MFDMFGIALQVGLKQGVEMLNIFKGYTEKTSLFDDFGFYENREKCLEVKRSMKPAATLKVESMYRESDFTVSTTAFLFKHTF